MAVKTESSPFGGTARTRVLLSLRLLGDSYARELARVLDMPFSSVQKALRSLEKDGLVAGRALGRTRVVTLNPRYFALDDLERFLLRLTEPEFELKARVSSLRRRPRRTAKPL
ncbi:MAG: winged helix-turn-helix transcriptional regulator [Candidatus Rokubacteria bacterium]|nr:winged helix-turn-helix transcriptional regulator [Candidatus Rokubacteria bacterium]